MKLSEATKNLIPISNPTKLLIQEKLNSGATLLCGNVNNYNIELKYLFFVKGNILYFYTLVGSTENQIILNLDQTNKMIPGIFDLIYSNYLVKQDVILEDVKNNFSQANYNNHGLTDKDIINQMKTTDILSYQ